MRRNRLYAFAVAVTVAAVAAPALAGTVHAHAAKHRTTTKVGPRGPRGARGARGAAGPTGPAGPAGAPGANGSSAGPFERTIVVSPVGSASASGAALVAAVSAIAGAAAPSPYLVWVEPGVYDIGASVLDVPSDVDVQGSGQNITTIEGEGSLALAAAGNTELRELTVTDTDPDGAAEAIGTSGGLQDVTATATGTSAATAVLANGPTLPLVDVTASATASSSASFVQAIETQDTAQIEGGSFTATDEAGVGEAAALFAQSATAVRDATLSASGGSAAYPVDVIAPSATVTIDGSTLVGAGGFSVAAGDTLDVGGSQIPGIVSSVSGTAHCPDDWLVDYATASTDCT